MSPLPPADSDPLDPYTRPSAPDPRIDSRKVGSSTATNGILVAAVIAVLAVIAYFMFAGGSPTTIDEAATPATTETAPDATAPAEPATPPAAAPSDTMAPAPDATAPAEPAQPAAPAQ